jgi:ABC-type multidrug transport system fused ATPase/permease subunit
MSQHEIDIEEAFAKTALRRATLGRLISYFAPHRRAMWFVLSFEALWVVSMIFDPRLIRWITDGPLPEGDVGGVALLVGLMILNIVTRAALTAYELRLSTRVGVQVLDTMRREVFEHIQRLSMRYFDRTRQGRIIARADRDVDTLEHLVFWGPIMITMTILSFSLGTVMLISSNAGLAVWLLGAVPIVWILTRLFHHWGFPAYRRIRETHSAISSHVAETIGGVRVVQAFNAEAREDDRLTKSQDAYYGATVRAARIMAAYMPSLGLPFHAVMLIILWFGGQNVMDGTMTPGALLEFMLLMGFVLGPVENLGGLYNQCLIAGAAAERIFLLLDTEPEVKDAPGVVDPGRLRGAIEFDHVSFSYDPEGKDGRQLMDVTFQVEPGETLALVGHTGAGKSSIVNLLMRFYEAQEGEVRIDGIDVRKIPLATLHSQTGIVLQSSFLFAGSVLENLAFVVPGITAEEARAGFVALGCDQILDQLPEGLASDVGERGANLSEGERQIVCFVRAWLAKPSLLILDEATSAVDTRTEALLLQALHNLTEQQTTVVIAHRLSTIRDADRILVMEEGRIVEVGTHDSLLELGGTYAGLYAEYGG